MGTRRGVRDGQQETFSHTEIAVCPFWGNNIVGKIGIGGAGRAAELFCCLMNGISEAAVAVIEKMRAGAVLVGAVADFGRDFGLTSAEPAENVPRALVMELFQYHLIAKSRDLDHGQAEFVPV
jgi:hypothetical protein